MTSPAVNEAADLAIVNPVQAAHALVAFIDERVIPAAIRAGIFTPIAVRQSIVLEYADELVKENFSVPWGPSLALGEVRKLLAAHIILVHWAPENAVDMLDEIRPVLSKLRHNAVYFIGYCEGVLAARTAHIEPAAENRRKIGARSRERVRAAATEYLGKLSREQAAPLIAKKASLEPGTVRRMLSQLFPGEAWGAVLIDDSSSGDID